MYVWGHWFAIVIGIIFGAWDSPGWFYILSKLQADISPNYNCLQEQPAHHLVHEITVPDPPFDEVVVSFAYAALDLLNLGINLDPAVPTHHATFVDNNLMAET